MEAEEYSISQMCEISLRAVLGAIFIWAGSMKLLDLDSFVQSVSDFQFAPFDQAPWDMWIGYALPVFEVIVGTSLILGILLKGAMISALVLCFSFLIVIISAHARGLNYECGCFGRALSFENTAVHIGILSLMIVLVVVLIFLELRNSKPNNDLK